MIGPAPWDLWAFRGRGPSFHRAQNHHRASLCPFTRTQPLSRSGGVAATVWWLGTGSPQKDTARAQPGKAGKGVLSGPCPSLTPPRPDADRCPVMAASSGHTCSAPLSPDPGSPAPGAQPAAPHRYGVPISAHLSASPPTALVPPFLTCHAGQDSHAAPPPPPGPRARASVFPPRPGTGGVLQPKLPGARPGHSRTLPATGV